MYNVFVVHTDGNEFFTNAKAHLHEVAESSGYRKEVLRVIADRNGRPRFEVFRFTESRSLHERGRKGPRPDRIAAPA